MLDNTAKRDGGIQSVNRAISVLQVLARRGPLTVTEIGAELAVHKSTVFRLLATLESRGLIDQNVSRGRYQLGYGVVQLAAGATRAMDLSVTSRPVCEDLAEAAGETVNIAIHDGSAVVSIDQVIGSATVTSVNWVGQRSPVHATSAGKVFLAFMDGATRAAHLAEPLPRFTDRTIVDTTELERQLVTVRERGYSVAVEEHEIGLAAVAAPIRGLEGDVIAAVTVSGPTFRLDDTTIPTIAAQVLAAAATISERNGQPKPG